MLSVILTLSTAELTVRQHIARISLTFPTSCPRGTSLVRILTSVVGTLATAQPAVRQHVGRVCLTFPVSCPKWTASIGIFASVTSRSSARPGACACSRTGTPCRRPATVHPERLAGYETLICASIHDVVHTRERLSDEVVESWVIGSQLSPRVYVVVNAEAKW